MAVARVTGTPTATTTVAPRRTKAPFLYRPLGIWTVRILTVAAILGSWQLYARNLPRALGAPPTEIATAAWHQISSGSIVHPLESSMIALSLGFLLALAVGIPIGVLMGRWRPIEYVLDPYISFLYALPHVAFVPLMIVWFGFELKFRLAYVLLSAVFPVIINTMTGVKNVDPELLAVGKSLCASTPRVLRTIILPGASPYIVAGARQAFSSAWVGVIVAEVLATQDGLGGLITHYSNFFLTADMYVPILFIMFIAVTIQSIADFFQARLTPWSNLARRRR
jgi:NitT/TauT family transport system permease protein